MEDSEALREAFEQFISRYQGQIMQSEIVRKNGKLEISADVKLPEPITHQMAMCFLTEYEGIYSISV